MKVYTTFILTSSASITRGVWRRDPRRRRDPHEATLPGAGTPTQRCVQCMGFFSGTRFDPAQPWSGSSGGRRPGCRVFVGGAVRPPSGPAGTRSAVWRAVGFVPVASLLGPARQEISPSGGLTSAAARPSVGRQGYN